MAFAFSESSNQLHNIILVQVISASDHMPYYQPQARISNFALVVLSQSLFSLAVSDYVIFQRLISRGYSFDFFALDFVVLFLDFITVELF